jgi:hypothetical protein
MAMNPPGRAGHVPLWVLRAHEVVSAVNLGSALMAFFFLGTNSAISTLFEMDRALSRFVGLLPSLHEVPVPKDSFTSGYFAFFLPATALAAFFWFLLRRFGHTRPTLVFLRSFAGISALAASPAWWLCATYRADVRADWNPLTAIQFYELLLIIFCGLLYVFRGWPSFEWAMVLMVLLHYGFWFWQFGDRLYFMGYGGAITPAIGLCASLLWLLYLRQTKLLSLAEIIELGSGVPVG